MFASQKYKLLIVICVKCTQVIVGPTNINPPIQNPQKPLIMCSDGKEKYLQHYVKLFPTPHYFYCPLYSCSVCSFHTRAGKMSYRQHICFPFYLIRGGGSNQVSTHIDDSSSRSTHSQQANQPATCMGPSPLGGRQANKLYPKAKNN